MAGEPSNTVKHAQFLSGPMGQQLVIVLPGIGPHYQAQLARNGIHTAYQLFGQFLVNGKDEQQFTAWFHENTADVSGANGAYVNYQQLCFGALNAWDAQYF